MAPGKASPSALSSAGLRHPTEGPGHRAHSPANDPGTPRTGSAHGGASPSSALCSVSSCQTSEGESLKPHPGLSMQQQKHTVWPLPATGDPTPRVPQIPNITAGSSFSLKMHVSFHPSL